MAIFLRIYTPMWIRGTYPIDVHLMLQVNSAFYG